MPWLYQPLLMLIARSCDSELARQVEFLKVQNEMLRRRVKRVRLDAEERRLLVRLGVGLGHAARALLTVVAYSTYRRFVVQSDPPEGRDRQAGP
jgi:putative transposase